LIEIKQCTLDDYEVIDDLFKKLINEIVQRTTGDHNLFSLTDTRDIFNKGLQHGIYSVFKAQNKNQTIGFISICESFSLYADGRFGIIQELYVVEEYRSKHVGRELIKFATEFGKEKGWKRLEVCTPSLPEFERTLEFYKNNGFEIIGGKKLKTSIDL